MRRLHLFEFGDLPWLPRGLRDFITEHLSVQTRRAYLPATIRLALTLKLSGHRQIVDLCSGSGAPVSSLLHGLSAGLRGPVSATLTDLYPNREALDRLCRGREGLAWCPSAVDAAAVPEHLVGLRTIFSAFHHFEPERAARVLQDAVDAGMPIAVFELQDRRLARVLLLPLIMLLSSFVLTPFIGNLSVTRLALTYLLPIAPLCLAWDTLVSCLRSYTAQELQQLADSLDSAGFRWETGQIRSKGPFGPYPITFLVGAPTVDRDTKQKTD